jgi:carboxylesterase type B
VLEPATLADHGCDEYYTLDTKETKHLTLTKNMQKWWTNFAIHHDPNGKNEKKEWPPIS